MNNTSKTKLSSQIKYHKLKKIVNSKSDARLKLFGF